MLGLLDLILSIGDLLLSWRVYLAMALVVTAILIVISVVPNSMARWLICAPIAIAGVGGGLYWQAKASSGEGAT